MRAEAEAEEGIQQCGGLRAPGTQRASKPFMRL